MVSLAGSWLAVRWEAVVFFHMGASASETSLGSFTWQSWHSKNRKWVSPNSQVLSTSA